MQFCLLSPPSPSLTYLKRLDAVCQGRRGDESFSSFSPLWGLTFNSQSVAEGLNLAKRICHAACYVQHLAPRVVGIFYNYRSVRVNDLDDVAL